MPKYGEVLNSPRRAYSAKQNADGTYENVQRFEYIQGLNFDFEHDTDTIKGSGVNLEMLSVITGVTVTINEAAAPWDLWALESDLTVDESGTTGNRVKSITIEGGGKGMQYTGKILEYFGANNEVIVVGIAKTKLQKLPSFEVEQNTYRTGSMEYSGIAVSEVGKKVMEIKVYESADDVPDFSQASNWETFFSNVYA